MKNSHDATITIIRCSGIHNSIKKRKNRMPKRSWVEANSGTVNSVSPPKIVSNRSSFYPSLPKLNRHGALSATDGSIPGEQLNPTQEGSNDTWETSPKAGYLRHGHTSKASRSSRAGSQPNQPGITRKVKACAACRKQKVRAVYLSCCSFYF